VLEKRCPAEREVRAMAVEQARAQTVPKPWGLMDLHPWSDARHDGGRIGEIWYERPDKAATGSSLLLKLLFTSQPLSIQVHPDDAFAHSIGLPNGKTEAWYVLSAEPDAKVALGLKQSLNPQQLREAIETGSISDLVQWRCVSADDIIFVPAGTIHAIGAGLVIAEIQQRSDATFRLFDYGRQRELHIEHAIAVAKAGPADFLSTPTRLTDARTVLVSNAHFVFERLDLAPAATWCLEAERETWLLVLQGSGRVGSFDVGAGDALFAQSDRVTMQPGPGGMVALAAYTGGGPVTHLLRRIATPAAMNAVRSREVRVPLPTKAMAAPTNRHRDVTP
jgi:mannose-6-phosphate isomerase